MDNHTIYYDTIIKLTSAISRCKDPAKVALITAESVTNAFAAKGCAVFLVDRETREMGLVTSHGMSSDFYDKGPIHFMQEIKEAKDAVPIAIHDVNVDPRIEYPEKIKKEGIASLLGVPIISHDKIIGALRIYTSKPWEFSVTDISMAQAVALICGMAMEMCWMHQDHESFKTDIQGKDTFGLGRPQTMSQLLKCIRGGMKLPDSK
ncbi:MAG: GAF domain-containing protein [Desulfobacula sp.]|nr:GAF domain-containing protein [Desulfobacula sp.]